MKPIKALWVLATSALLLSCERRPLDIIATGLMINHTPDYSLPYEKPAFHPEHYRTNMYDSGTGDLVYKDFVPERGGMIRSIPGSYLCFLCNYDEGTLVLSGENSINSFHITGPRAPENVQNLFAAFQDSLNTPADMKQDVMLLGDCFWAGKTITSVPPLSDSDETFVIDVETTSVLKQGHVCLNNITGQENIAVIDCFVSNLSAGINPVTMELDIENITEEFTIIPGDGPVEGSFLYFGVNNGKEPRFLYALVTDTGGGRYLYIYELGAVDEEEGLNFIIDSKMVIREPVPDGKGGYIPTVRDWEIEHTEIPLG